MKTYTIEQIRKYLAKIDSLGDALYFCDEEHMDKSQEDDDTLENCENYKLGDCQCVFKCEHN